MISPQSRISQWCDGAKNTPAKYPNITKMRNSELTRVHLGALPLLFYGCHASFSGFRNLYQQNLRYSQTFNTTGIMASCIFNVHWSSITPSTEKAPWDCVHLKVLYELPSHKDSGNQKSCSEFVLCEWVGSRNQPVYTYVSSSISGDGVSHPQEIWGGLESLRSQTQPLIVVLIWKTWERSA